ncbi:MAG: hypothetical protein WCF12_10870, partial [Propionicimonas sp.]
MTTRSPDGSFTTTASTWNDACDATSWLAPTTDEAEFDAALATAAAQYSITDGACPQSAGTCNTSSRGFNSVV